MTDSKTTPVRTADYPVEQIILERWSPRALSGERVTHQEMFSLFEAARWAPSSYNEQEWRFLYAWRDTGYWDTFFELLVDANKVWCQKASALLVILSRRNFRHNGKANPSHTFDTGAAFQNLALQGYAMGLVVHPMGGFDRERARNNLGIPDFYQVEAMAAIGRPGDPEDLPDDLREREKPSGRMPISQLSSEGRFTFD